MKTLGEMPINQICEFKDENDAIHVGIVMASMPERVTVHEEDGMISWRSPLLPAIKVVQVVTIRILEEAW